MPDSHAQVDVTEFRVVDVKKILADAGFEPAVFQEHQVRLLQLPQNLSLFLEAGFDASRSPAFGTATELFDRYWTEKRQFGREASRALPGSVMKAMEILCDEMTAAQQLSVAREKLDKVSPAYLDQLASEGVVTFDGRCYGFGHESFFDYCFARVFFTRSESLVSFLKGSEQHLFRRAQVRQVLAYLRDADSTRYVRELGGLLSDNGIRPHIKDLAFALLAEVTDPTEEEWTIWEKWLAPALKSIKEGTANPDKLSAIAWRLFFGSSSWFVDADRRGVIESWLASGNGLARRCCGELPEVPPAPCARSRRSPARTVRRPRRCVGIAASVPHGVGRPPHEPPLLRPLSASRGQRHARRSPWGRSR